MEQSDLQYLAMVMMQLHVTIGRLERENVALQARLEKAEKKEKAKEH